MKLTPREPTPEMLQAGWKACVIGDSVSEQLAAMWRAMHDAAPTVEAEPNLRHPKIQALIGGKARREIELSLVEQLLEDPNCDLSAVDMEYWNSMHDKLREKLLATPQSAALPESADKLREALQALVNSIDNNTGALPSSDVYERALDEARAALKGKQ